MRYHSDMLPYLTVAVLAAAVFGMVVLRKDNTMSDYPLSWDGFDIDLNEQSELLILADDGDSQHVIVLEPPVPGDRRGSFGTRHVYDVLVYVIDPEDDPAGGIVLHREMGPIESRGFRTTVKRRVFTQFFRLTRKGAKGDTATRYAWTEAGTAPTPYAEAASSAWKEYRGRTPGAGKAE